MGIENLEIEKHIVEHEIIKNQISKDFVPYVGAVKDVDLGDFDLKTLGEIIGINVTSGENPGHTHTGASLSGIDISSDTNLAVSSPITLTGDTIGFDFSTNNDWTGQNDFGGATNYARFDTAGNLTFAGTGNYIVGNNDYAFVSAFDNDIGLYFSLTNARYEFRTTDGSDVASINALSGHIFTDAGLTIGTNQFVGLQTPGGSAKGRIFFVDGTTDEIILENADIHLGNQVTDMVKVESGSGKMIFIGNAGIPFGEIYVADGSTAQTIPTGTTYTKLTAFTTNGQSLNVTNDATNDKITITKNGRYKVNLSMNGSVDKANTQFDGAVFLDGTIQNNIKCYNEFVAADKNCSAHICGFIDVTSAPKDVDVRLRHDDGGSVDLTIINANLNVIQIGGT